MFIFLMIFLILAILSIVFIMLIPYWLYFIFAIINILITKKIFNIASIIYFLLGLWLYKRQRDYKFKFYSTNDFNYNFRQGYSSDYQDFNVNNNFNSDYEYEKACEFFGVEKNAPYEEKKKIYRKLASKYHPDINKTEEAEEKMKEINSYWDIIERRGA